MRGVVEDFVPLIAPVCRSRSVRLTMELQVATHFTGCHLAGYFMSFVAARLIVHNSTLSNVLTRTQNGTE